MNLKKRLIAVAVMVLVAILAVVIAKVGTAGPKDQQAELLSNIGKGKETVLVWYTDEALTDYISSAAVAFNDNYKDQKVRVIPILESGLEYLENINKASVAGECPDLYILGHDSLEKAYLAGLAAEIEAPEQADLTTDYPEVGLHAATYHEKILGYPFYFETSALLYNRTYLEEMAASQLEAEADEAAALEATEELENNGPEEEVVPVQTEESSQAADDPVAVENRVAVLLPQTLDDMKKFADTYDAPEQVEAVFKWDVTDIFYNYFFVGNTMVVGGESGDDTENIDIYNPNAINSMKMYQNLNQFFAIDTNEVEYKDIIDDFISGKLVFTVATTDVVAKLEHAAEDGLFPYEYGIIRTPDIDEETPTRSVSMTNCVVVNGYSEHQEAANAFAYYLTKGSADNLYARTGKVAAAQGIDYGYENLSRFAEEYARSVPLPKMIETSNFWVQLEIAFAQIWDGANANKQLKRLSEQIMTQITGEPYTEESIEETEEETQVEYLDEETLRQEAMNEE